MTKNKLVKKVLSGAKKVVLGAGIFGATLFGSTDKGYGQPDKSLAKVTSYDQKDQAIISNKVKVHAQEYAFTATDEINKDNLETSVDIHLNPTVFNNYVTSDQTYTFKREEVEKKEGCDHCDGYADRLLLKKEEEDAFGITAKQMGSVDPNLPYIEIPVNENVSNKLFKIKIRDFPGYILYNGKNAKDSIADYLFAPSEGVSIGISKDGRIELLSKNGFYKLVLKESELDEIKPIFDQDYDKSRKRVENRLGTVERIAEAYVPEGPDACKNGIKDEGEKDIDCGGPCPPCGKSNLEFLLDVGVGKYFGKDVQGDYKEIFVGIKKKDGKATFGIYGRDNNALKLLNQGELNTGWEDPKSLPTGTLVERDETTKYVNNVLLDKEAGIVLKYEFGKGITGIFRAGGVGEDLEQMVSVAGKETKTRPNGNIEVENFDATELHYDKKIAPTGGIGVEADLFKILGLEEYSGILKLNAEGKAIFSQVNPPYQPKNNEIKGKNYFIGSVGASVDLIKLGKFIKNKIKKPSKK